MLYSYELQEKSQGNMVILNSSRAPKHSATDMVTEPEYEMMNVFHNHNTNISMIPNPAYDVSTAVSRTSAAYEGDDGTVYEALDKTDRI